jgi:hypothetical protein
MWKEVNAFWVRSGAALVLLGAAASPLFTEDLAPHSAAFLGVGLLFICLTWRQINLGSLTWIRNWQTHLDLLEDSVTGPLYKTVFHDKAHSTTQSISGLSLLAVWGAHFVAPYHIAEWAKIGFALDSLEPAVSPIDFWRTYLLIFFLLFLPTFLFIHWNVLRTEDAKHTLVVRKVQLYEKET